MFEYLKNIDVSNSYSWKNKIFLTFDLDWCSNEILLHILDIVEEYNIKATFFVTHETPLLKRMRDNKNIELGIHPNFNPLLNGDFRYGKNCKEVIEYYMKIVPEALSSRSHSITNNSYILEELISKGITHESNILVPFSSNSYLEPWKYWNNKLTRVPYFWEDDVHCTYNWEWNSQKLIDYNGIKVFDFHPNNLFLNCSTVKHYNNAKAYFSDYKKLKDLRNTKYGELDFFKELVRKVKN